MRKLALLMTILASLILGGYALAESDAQIKAQLVGYWLSPRYAYLIQSDGLKRMCPTTGLYRATTVNRWDIRNGFYYEDGEPYRIVKLTKTKFDYACTKDIEVWANGKFIVTAPAGTVFPPSRTTREKAEKY
jgi:hypothetical protein